MTNATKEMTSFERHGRAVKVGALLAGLPKIVAEVMPSATDERIAVWLASLAKQDRARVAVLCGVKLPSETTWTLLVERVRTRATDPDMMLDNCGVCDRVDQKVVPATCGDCHGCAAHCECGTVIS